MHTTHDLGSLSGEGLGAKNDGIDLLMLLLKLINIRLNVFRIQRNSLTVNIISLHALYS